MIGKVDVLGTVYTIERKGYKEDPAFEKRGIMGYQDPIMKRIVICRAETHPQCEDETEEFCERVERHCRRHEIVHAFLEESGLSADSLQSPEGWARNEEMVDWIALQAPKIFRAFEEAQCWMDQEQ